MALRRVVFGLLGTKLDAAGGRRWRPTVALCRHPEFPVDRLELLHDERSAPLADRVRAEIAGVSPATEVRSQPFALRDPWDFEEVYGVMHDFAAGYPFEPEEEDYLVNFTTGTHVTQICWFLLIEARLMPARILQLIPPRDWQDTDAGSYSVIDLDLSRYDRIADRFRRESAAATAFLKAGIETRSPAFNRMIDRIEQVAVRSTAPMLLMGPTGAGKSQLARRIYELRRERRQLSGAFVEVNCATLRGEGAMSALFGHVRGAFTGAAQDRAGLIRAADKGMLLLDEIGELGIDEQAMILRAIEDRRFLPVGSDREVESDFLLVAGTNRDLSHEVAAGRFREDLFARLNLWSFELPGLAERREDIEPNLDFELDRHAERTGSRITFDRAARRRYLAFATSERATWAANFRDLGASVTRMATLAPGGRIDEATVVEEIGRLERSWAQKQSGGDGLLDGLLEGLFDADALAGLDRFDRVQLADVVAVCRASPSLSAAGRTLFAASRAAKASTNDADRLRKYLARFGLDWQAMRGG